MNDVILTARFTVKDLKEAGPMAVIAVDTYLTTEEEEAIDSYNRWLRKEREEQKAAFEKARSIFEKNNNLKEYESFKNYYFDALDKATTQKETFALFMERTKFVLDQLNL